MQHFAVFGDLEEGGIGDLATPQAELFELFAAFDNQCNSSIRDLVASAEMQGHKFMAVFGDVTENCVCEAATTTIELLKFMAMPNNFSQASISHRRAVG